MKNELRPIVIDGHQEHWKGYFHAWAGLSEYPKAIVESLGGHIKVVDAYKITFMDREKEDAQT